MQFAKKKKMQNFFIQLSKVCRAITFPSFLGEDIPISIIILQTISIEFETIINPNLKTNLIYYLSIYRYKKYI